jgi:hypothetical protein
MLFNTGLKHIVGMLQSIDVHWITLNFHLHLRYVQVLILIERDFIFIY